MVDRNRIIDQFLGDDKNPIQWANAEEQKLHFWFDDLHCPQPISPMWFDVGGWWYTCGYMYRRFGVPFGKEWVAKTINEYVYTAVIARDPKEEAELGRYYNMVMSVYAENFMDWWKNRYLPEILHNFEFLDHYPMDSASLPELMILLEDALDIQERHFRIHWILNLAQFQSAWDFKTVFAQVLGKEDNDLVGRILISDEDRNWDSVRELWRLKERIKGSETLKAAFRKGETAGQVMKLLEASKEGQALLQEIDDYKLEYGNKAIYTHEYIFTTWRENPAPIVEALRSYLDTDYDVNTVITELRKNRQEAIEEMWGRVPEARTLEDREKLQRALDLALQMVPLTPDHHFYMDQGTYARVRLVFMAIGRKLVEAGVFNQADDVFYLKYDELRVLSANFSAYNAKALIRDRRRSREEAFNYRPRLWAGTITEWSLYGEPYKTNWGWPDIYTKADEMAQQRVDIVKGLGASTGVVEGVARIVHSPEEFDQVQKGEIVVCTMTNPAWVVVFTKISGLVTDTGGALSHPAVVSREFGIPAVVGTGVATQKIKTGQRIRVNGAAGIVQILD
jgi:phosphohistidine swiveling domain-containing protein